ncbi:hypothetical protein [Granulicella tundricola]|uniref:Uncharacterized protein n=1 Tax=Granulicella tundricola (strain ATCC BAA-1859 / DSM 23138 / MP5ACTX9) TaxID=1198114 RepID=E8WX02_GRATM|nr:hypothetical protein [Granulicella tundricola]ADW68563.1 hypothetical protein AciX9_1510 [Granulicella tundricola MP5ACTX9]
MSSIFIFPTPNAAFTATVRSEWTRILPDGSKASIFNHRFVARDSSGRVFQERRYLTPQGDKQETEISVLQYDDPNRHERYQCYPQRQMCERSRLYLPTASPAPMPSGPLPNGNGTMVREDLGHKAVQGVDAVGSREITTLKVGAFGNEKVQPVVRELWFSPHLQMNLVTERFDPRASAVQNIYVTDLKRDEPDPKWFQIPSGYRVVGDGLER